MSEKIIGALRIDENNCGLSNTDLTMLNVALSNCLSLDVTDIYTQRIATIWTRITMLNDFWAKRTDEHKF